MGPVDSLGTRVALGTALGFATGAMVLAEIDLPRLVEGERVETWWLLGIVTLAALGAIAALFDGNEVAVEQPAVRIIAVLGGWLLFSSLLSDKPVDALAATVAFGALAVVAVRVRAAFGWTPLAMVAVAVLGIYLVISAVTEVVADPQLRVNGRLFLLSLDANQLARLAGLALLSGVALITTRRYYSMIVGLVAVPIALFALVLGQSRTGTVALAAAVAVLLWHRVHRAVAVAACAAAVLAFGLLVPALLDVSVHELVAREGESTSLSTFRGRTTTWSAAVDAVRDDPLVGRGPSLDDEFFARARQAGEISWPARNAHSLWGHLVVVGGLPALLLFVGAIGLFAFGAGERPSAYGYAVVALLLLDGVSEAVLWVPGLSGFLLIGALAMRGRSPAAVDPLVEVRALRADRGRVAVPG